jgi:hypothetical protein
MTLEEIHRYLVGVCVPMDKVIESLNSGKLIPQYIVHKGNYYPLSGKEEIIDHRLKRARIADEKWNEAINYGTKLASFPFIRMVAVTGALALNNVEKDADIDYLIVTKPGRLWVSRALSILIVHLAKLSNIEICPNYFLSENSLQIHEVNLFTARELTQMVPIFGWEIYNKMMEINTWTRKFLPNASGLPLRGNLYPIESNPIIHQMKITSEAILQTSPGSWLESWEMKRKIKKLTRNSGDDGEYLFTTDVCKGHFHSHSSRTIVAFENRINQLLIQMGQ